MALQPLELSSHLCSGLRFPSLWCRYNAQYLRGREFMEVHERLLAKGVSLGKDLSRRFMCAASPPELVYLGLGTPARKLSNLYASQASSPDVLPHIQGGKGFGRLILKMLMLSQ